MFAKAGITQLLARWHDGDEIALEKLTQLVYRDFKRLAAGRLRSERRAHTLQPTALVHETYLRLMDNPPTCQNRSNFYGKAAHVMRQVLIQHARARNASKRGGRIEAEPIQEAVLAAAGPAPEVDRLNEVIARLSERDPRKSDVLELRYFGGFTNQEIAERLGLSLGTIERDLRLAIAWVRREMTS